MKYLLQGKLIAKSGHQEALIDIMNRASKLMLSKAKGCELYAVGSSHEDINVVFITEIWASKEDHELSLSVEGVKELIAEAMPILSSPPQKGLEINVLNL